MSMERTRKYFHINTTSCTLNICGTPCRLRYRQCRSSYGSETVLTQSRPPDRSLIVNVSMKIIQFLTPYNKNECSRELFPDADGVRWNGLLPSHHTLMHTLTIRSYADCCIVIIHQFRCVHHRNESSLPSISAGESNCDNIHVSR